MAAGRQGVYWRITWAGVGALVALGLVALTWLLTSVVKSPQEALASAAPPPPSRITVPVELRRLDNRVRTTAEQVSDSEVRGRLSVDQRDKAAAAAQVLVTGAAGTVAGRLDRVEADGSFVVVLEAPVAVGDRPSVQVDFKPARPGAPGLVVPISALFTSASGDVAVVVVRRGAEHEVRVSMATPTDGFSTVVPRDPAALSAGDQVLVSEPAS